MSHGAHGAHGVRGAHVLGASWTQDVLEEPEFRAGPPGFGWEPWPQGTHYHFPGKSHAQSEQPEPGQL